MNTRSGGYGIYTRDHMLSPYDQCDRLQDLILAGFNLAKNGDVKEIPRAAAEQYGVRPLPLMATLFAVVDRPDAVRLCGVQRNYGSGDYCSCILDTPDGRRCRHLWAVDFHLFRRGLNHSNAIERHENFLDGRYPELRRILPMFPGDVDPRVDLEGLSVFSLVAHSAVFRELFDRFSSRKEVYKGLKAVVDAVDERREVSYTHLANALKDHDKLRYIFAEYDAALLLHSVFEYFDGRTRGFHFRRLLRWAAETSTKCDLCDFENVAMDQFEGWKKVVVPTAAPPPSLQPPPTLPDLMNDSHEEWRRLNCPECLCYTFHQVEHSLVETGGLLLVDVHKHPRLGFGSAYHIPPSMTVWTPTASKTYDLVGFLVRNPIRSNENGYSVVIREGRNLWETVDGDVVPYDISSDARIATVMLFQVVSEGRPASPIPLRWNRSPTPPPPPPVEYNFYPSNILACASPRVPGRRRCFTT